MNLRNIQFYGSADEIGNQISSLASKIQPIVAAIIGGLAAVVLLAAIVYSIVFFLKAGFSSEPEQRKKHIKGLLWLWICFLGIMIIWGLSAAIIEAVSAIMSSGGF